MIEIDFYFITDPNLTRSNVIVDVKEAIDAGVKIIQYREKNKPTKIMVEEAKRIKEICKGKAVLLINDRIDVALAVGADGVHLGQEDMPFRTARRLLGDKIIGLTVHNVEEAVLAEQIGADYVGASPIFATTTKKDAGNPGGVQLIKDIKEKINIPIVAIGGITLDNVGDVIGGGADGAVAISAVVGKDVKEKCKKFIDVIRSRK